MAQATSDPLPDLDAVRARYREERDRRLRPEGESQYHELSGRFAHYLTDDPYVAPGFSREPVSDAIDVAIIGGGFSGMLAAARLSRAGVRDIRIIEAGGDFGGTWYWNRYPGAQCDVESYCYLPLLEELGVMPREKYSYAPEIFDHSRRIGREFGLYDLALFQTRVESAIWQEQDRRWLVSTHRGDAIRARFVIMAIGPASRPRLPGIPGIESFAGHSFHTSRWDYGYTGGGPEGGLDKLADKTVAIIGTGATAIQCVPHLARGAEHLYVFQRTPSSVDLRSNRPTDAGWAGSLEPGWQRARRKNFADIVEGKPVEEDLVRDGWTDAFLRLRGTGGQSDGQPADAALAAELADAAKMATLRARVDAVVADPTIAEQLKPWYRYLCKRPTFNDEYLATFNRANVTLVDTSPSRGVERITPRGVVANGVEYAVDCIVYASGFEITSSVERRIGFEVMGRDGRTLSDHWRHGFQTLHGFAAHGFPNWFYIGISQNGFSVNMTAMFDDQAQHVAYIVSEAMNRQVSRVEPTAEAEAAWVHTIRRLATSRLGFYESCTPGYYNNEGELHGGIIAEAYAPGLSAFNELLAEWRERGDLDGLSLTC